MMAGSYYPPNVTTDHIQQYLDENKSLILKIVESQNSGKLNECAENQARLQRNLMYLAALADSQPQPPTMHSQFAGSGMLQSGAPHYMAPHQQMNPQSLISARSSSMLHGAQPHPSLPQPLAMYGGLLGMNSAASSGLMLQGEPQVGTNVGLGLQGFPDFIRGGGNNNGNSDPSGFGFGGEGKHDMGSNEGRGDGGETLYLKSADEEN